MSVSFIDGLNIGTQQNVIITRNDTGETLILDGRRTKFTSKATDKAEPSDGVDNGGLIEHAWIPGAWSGSIDFERKSDAFGEFIAFMEAYFYSGGVPPSCTIQVGEPTADLSYTAQYRYTKVKFTDYNPGDWTRGIVKGSVSFVAQARIKDQ